MARRGGAMRVTLPSQVLAMHLPCTYYALAMHLTCTHYRLWAYSHALAMLLPCTCHVLPTYLLQPYTRSQLPHTCHVHLTYFVLTIASYTHTEWQVEETKGRVVRRRAWVRTYYP